MSRRRFQKQRANRTRLPQLPPPNDPGFGRALKETMEVFEGLRGDPRDAVVTFRDLEGAGLGRFNARLMQLDTSRQGEEADTDGDDVEVPKVPAGFQAEGLFEVVMLSWSAPGYRGHDYTEIVRARSDEPGQFVPLTQTRGAAYSDTVGGNFIGWYRIRHVNVNGVAGEWSEAVKVRTPTAPEYMLRRLTGEIRDSQLHQSLSEPISKIPDLEQATDNLSDATDQLETRIEAVEVNAWDDEADYEQGDIVGHGGKAYQALETMAAPSQEPPGDKWEEVGVTDSIKSVIEGRASAIRTLDSRVTETEDGVESNASAITGIQADLYDEDDGLEATASAVEDLEVTVTQQGNDISANASDISGIQADLYDDDDGLEATASAVDSLEVTVAQHDDDISANAQSISGLEADVYDDDTGLSATAQAVEDLEVTVSNHDGQISANASDISGIQSELEDDDGVILASADNFSSLQTQVQQNENDISAEASRIDQLFTEVGEEYPEWDSSNSYSAGDIVLYDAAHYEANTSVSSGGDPPDSSSEWDEIELDTVYAGVQTNSSAVASLEGDVYAEHTIKVDANGNVAGIGLFADEDQTMVGILADRFYITHDDSDSDFFPFIVDDGTVYIDEAGIREGVIETAHIQDGFLDNLTASHGQLNTARINIAEIWDLNIGNEIIIGDPSSFHVDLLHDDPEYFMWAGTGSRTDDNAVFYLKPDGSAFFGGSLSVGVINTSTQGGTPGAEEDEIILGPFEPIESDADVFASFSWNASTTQDGSCPSNPSDNTFTLVVERREESDGSWTQISSRTITIPTETFYNSEMDQCTVSASGSESWKAVDTISSTQDRRYRLRITDYNSYFLSSQVGGQGLSLQVVME